MEDCITRIGRGDEGEGNDGSGETSKVSRRHLFLQFTRRGIGVGTCVAKCGREREDEVDALVRLRFVKRAKKIERMDSPLEAKTPSSQRSLIPR